MTTNLLKKIIQRKPKKTMEEMDFGTAGEPTATPLRKPATEIAKIMSKELIKICELKEYCNFLESDLNNWCKKVETLTSAKNDNSKTVSEYKNRNKINAINSESLLQALNELYKYKSELKSIYIVTEKGLKMKKLKYKKILSSYESAWQKALKAYNADPFFMELNEIQKENTLLEIEIEKQETLKASTETQLADLKRNLLKTFTEKAVEFSKAMVQYKQLLNSTEQNEEKKFQNENKNSGNFPFKLSTAKVPIFSGLDNSVDHSYPCSIDVSVFDEIMIPSENLENLEEETSSAEVSKEEALEYLNNSRPAGQPKTSVKRLKGNSDQVDDDESHYFRMQPSGPAGKHPTENLQFEDQWNQSKENLNKNSDNSGEKPKSMNSGLQQGENEGEPAKDVQMECEESVSDGSYEKQMVNERGDDSRYHKTSSFSSEDLHPGGENLNESPESISKVCEQNGKSDSEKNEFKSFTGFFTMGNDQSTSKPSIFKLF